ncbi:MAG TPA: chemotaxis protein CheA, partial [Actinobacteria bacterium]|nr:chemotaxis protein CheA [Actinomycetota bacterium]
SIVSECVELKREEAEKAHGRRVANVRGELIPYIRLRETFLCDGQPPPIEQIVITEIEGQRVGFVVDYVIGGHQTVIKNMGRVFRNLEGVSGATILGDGSVALILNAPKLAQRAELEEQILA